MLSGWTRALILSTAVVLLAGAQCYAACGTITCKSPQIPANTCHHHKSPQQDQGCSHRHAEFTGPQSATPNVGSAHDGAAAAILAHPSPASSADSFARPAH